MQKQEIAKFENYLFENDFSSRYITLIKNFKNKKTVLYGAGKFFDYIDKNFDLSRFQIIAIADEKFKNEKSANYNYKYPTITPYEIDELNPDVVLISTFENYENIRVYLKEIIKNKKTQIIPLIKEKTEEILYFPIGHYYSPIPSRSDIQNCLSQQNNVHLGGIDLNKEVQSEYFKSFKKYLDTYFWKDSKTEDLYFYTNNNFFARGCSFVLYSFIMDKKPKRIIEIGSGFSTAVMADVNKKFFNNKIDITCVEPNPERLAEIFGKNIKNHVTFYHDILQNISLNLFETLEENDILFVDSSHVSKLNSDVNKIFFEILPKLNKGVIIHFHDISYPFEYSEAWIKENRAWNEAYLLRAFLQYNSVFKILFWGDYLTKEKLADGNIDLGSSIWLQKL